MYKPYLKNSALLSHEMQYNKNKNCSFSVAYFPIISA